MLIVAAGLLLVLGASLHGLRTAQGGRRWPFVAASAISGTALIGLVLAVLTAMALGRDTWNRWVSGSPSAETATLWLVLVVGPALLLVCVALLVTGSMIQPRQRRPGNVDPQGSTGPTGR